GDGRTLHRPHSDNVRPHTDQSDEQRRHHQRKPETPEERTEVPSDDSPKGIERTVCHIDHLQEAKDQGETQRQQGQDPAPDKTVHELQYQFGQKIHTRLVSICYLSVRVRSPGASHGLLGVIHRRLVQQLLLRYIVFHHQLAPFDTLDVLVVKDLVILGTEELTALGEVQAGIDLQPLQSLNKTRVVLTAPPGAELDAAFDVVHVLPRGVAEIDGRDAAVLAHAFGVNAEELAELLIEGF